MPNQLQMYGLPFSDYWTDVLPINYDSILHYDNPFCKSNLTLQRGYVSKLFESFSSSSQAQSDFSTREQPHIYTTPHHQSQYKRATIWGGIYLIV